MPSHVTHAVFTELAFEKAFAASPDPDTAQWLNFGASGPDFFFSGIRRKPSMDDWGYRMHGEGFGRTASAIASAAGSARTESLAEAPALEAYALGFSVHAVLDRAAHPLVNYLSGWVDSSDPRTQDLKFCHPFLERIIDMIILRDLKGLDLNRYNYPGKIPPASQLCALLPEVFRQAIEHAYPDSLPDFDIEEGVQNALMDDNEFLSLFEPTIPGGGPAVALEMEQKRELPERVLGLFYPSVIPPGDWLNEDGSGWTDPRRGGDKRRESFMDLFYEAHSDAVDVIRATRRVIAGEATPNELEELLGNGDLNDKEPGGPETPMKYCDPLALSPIIDSLYGEHRA